MKLRLNTHKPNPTLWIVALVLFLYGLLQLPYGSVMIMLSAFLLLLGTTIL